MPSISTMVGRELLRLNLNTLHRKNRSLVIRTVISIRTMLSGFNNGNINAFQVITLLCHQPWVEKTIEWWSVHRWSLVGNQRMSECHRMTSCCVVYIYIVSWGRVVVSDVAMNGCVGRLSSLLTRFRYGRMSCASSVHSVVELEVSVW